MRSRECRQTGDPQASDDAGRKIFRLGVTGSRGQLRVLKVWAAFPRPTAMKIDKFERMEELFNAALDVPTDQRLAFLERACGTDTGLLDALVRLLRHVNSTQALNDQTTETRL